MTKAVEVVQVRSHPDIKLKGLVRVDFSDEGVLVMSKDHYLAMRRHK